ncbi:MAG: MBL fold metallo-hydrolase [Solobacterium sp.]|nr:MBL fold metallo-hydrolase [Solobacterium sp.]
MKNCSVGKIGPDLFQFNEQNEYGPYVDAYMILGTKRAVIVDALQDAEDLYQRVRQITDLPFDLLLTHGHGDHTGKSVEYFLHKGARVWIMPQDLPMFRFYRPDADPNALFLLEDGMFFDLGGVGLEVILTAGHTPGSVVFLDRKNQRLFSGDAIGSGHFWMQIPYCLPLSEFRENLFRLYQTVRDMDHLTVYPGHRYQSPVQLNLQYVQDTLELTDMILHGEDNGEEKEMDVMGQHIRYKEAQYGMMLGYCYDPANL